MYMNFRTIFAICVISILCGGCLSADEPSSADIEQLFRDQLSVDATRVSSEAFDGVLTHPIYRLNYRVMAGDAGYSDGREISVWSSPEGLIGIYEPNTNDPLMFMDGLLDPSFRLNDSSSEQFMSALKAMMGSDVFEPVPVETIQNDGDLWYFLTGDFLSYYKGFAVTVDAEGAIQDIAYELSMIDQ